MTECERLIKDGIIPKSFFEKEIRNDFEVTEERKKIWAIQLDLFFEVRRICDRHNITYFILGGNLLGAVRHTGYIPWDDDFDILMFRKDYELFCSVCNQELQPPYFLQTTLTDNYWSNSARLCNSNTTGIRKPLIGLSNVNKGIFVDILPVDALSNNQLLRKMIYKIVKIKTSIATIYSFNIRTSTFSKAINWFFRLPPFKINLRKWYISVNRIASRANMEKAKQVGLVVWTPYKLEKVTWNKEDFRSFVSLPYEFLTIQVPVGYENILKVEYGDYMKFPPIEQRGGWHEFVFDPDTPYEEYFRKNGI